MTGGLPALADDGDICELATMENVSHVLQTLLGSCFLTTWSKDTSGTATNKTHPTSFDSDFTHDGEVVGVIRDELLELVSLDTM